MFNNIEMIGWKLYIILIYFIWVEYGWKFFKLGVKIFIMIVIK